MTDCVSYTFLSWCPHGTAAIRPRTRRGKVVSTKEEIDAFFSDNPDVVRLLSRFDLNFCYNYRTDGLFLFHFVCKEHLAADAMFVAKLLVSSIQEALGHTHFFHPKPARTTAKIYDQEAPDYHFLTLNPIQVSLQDEVKDLDALLSIDVVDKIIFDILWNDRHLAAVLSEQHSIFSRANGQGDVDEVEKLYSANRYAALHYREVFSRCVEKMLNVREIRRNRINTSLPIGLMTFLAWMTLVIPYIIYCLHFVEDSVGFVFVIIAKFIFTFFTILGMIVGTAQFLDARPKRCKIKKETWDKLDKWSELINFRWWITISVTLSIFSMFYYGNLFDPIEIYPSDGTDKFYIPSYKLLIDEILLGSNIWISGIPPLFGILLLWFYVDVFWNLRTVIKSIEHTIGVLHYGNIYSMVAKQLYALQPKNWSYSGGDTHTFDDAIEILKIVRKQDQSSLARKQLLFTALCLLIIIGMILAAFR